MSEESRYFRVGAFVLGGIALVVIFVMLLGSSSLLRKPLVAETVFDESVQGLEVGSPVKLRGVKIGTVSAIGFVGDEYDLVGTEDPLTKGNLVLVRMDLTLERAQGGREQQEREVAALVAKGLRVVLTPLGITGTSFVQADYLDPETYPPMKITWKPKELYVPSAPSTITRISSAADRVMTRINKLDVEGLLTNLDLLLENVNEVVAKADVEGVRKSLSALLEDARRTSQELRGTVGQNGFGATNTDLRQTLGRLGATLGRIDRLIDTSGEDLGTTMENLRVMSANLRDASETARSYPSLLLFGQPPRPSADPKSKPPEPKR